VKVFPAFSAHLRYLSFPLVALGISLRVISRLRNLPRDRLTRPSLLDLLCRDSKDSENLDHYLYDQILHRLGQSHLNICLETFEKVFDPLEEIDERVLARSDILSRLRGPGSELSATMKKITHY
jgi:hypothetical protein